MRSPQRDEEFVSSTGKSIEDYRNIIKQLKLKVTKLQIVNKELEEKIQNAGNKDFNSSSIEPFNNQKIPDSEEKASRLIGYNAKEDGEVQSDNVVMNMFFRSAQRLGKYSYCFQIFLIFVNIIIFTFFHIEEYS